jgi:two-component system, sensor histidine kinase and response regulator
MTRSANIRAALAGALAAVLVAMGIAFVDQSEMARFVREERTATLEAASSKRALLEAQLNAHLHLIRGLVAIARLRPDLSPEEFVAVIRGLPYAQSGVRSLQLARDAVISHIWPLAGNEQAVGYDLLADPHQRDAARRCIDSRALVVAGPFALRQGGVGLVAREPVFITDHGKERFWGLATVVLNLEPLLVGAGIAETGSGTRMALRGKDGTGAIGEVFFGDSSLFNQSPVVLDITLPSGTWQLAMAPADGWSTSWPGRPRLLTAALLLATLVATMAWRLTKGAERLRQALTTARESEMRFRSIFDQTFHGIATATPDGAVTAINDTACRFLGCDHTQAMGHPIWSLPWWAADERRLRDGLIRATAGETVRFEIARQHADGTALVMDVAIKAIIDSEADVMSLLIESHMARGCSHASVTCSGRWHYSGAHRFGEH